MAIGSLKTNDSRLLARTSISMYGDAGIVRVISVRLESAPCGIAIVVDPMLNSPPRGPMSAWVVRVCVDGHGTSVNRAGSGGGLVGVSQPTVMNSARAAAAPPRRAMGKIFIGRETSVGGPVGGEASTVRGCGRGQAA